MRLSGPLRDRIDLTVAVAAVPADELQRDDLAESSGEIRARVVAARERQLQRSGVLNARLNGRALRARATLSADARPMVMQAMARLSLSARAYDRILRVARTIADLEGIEQTSAQHVAEALQFRGP